MDSVANMWSGDDIKQFIVIKDTNGNIDKVKKGKKDYPIIIVRS